MNMHDEVKVSEETVEPTVKTITVDVIGGYTLPATLDALKKAQAMEQRYLRKAKRAWRGHTRAAFMTHAAYWQKQGQEHQVRLAQFESRFVNSIAEAAKRVEDAIPSNVIAPTSELVIDNANDN